MKSSLYNKGENVVMLKNTIRFCFVLIALGATAASNANVYDHACQPVQVYATGNRVHVQCAHPESNFSYRGTRITYFAAPLNSPLSAHITSIASSALANGKWLMLTYRAGADTSFGCLAHDCRPLVGIMLVPHVLTPYVPVDEPVE